jgi:hypothetical protein
MAEKSESVFDAKLKAVLIAIAIVAGIAR